MDTAKEHFLLHEALPLLRRLDEQTPPLWGLMNVRQMIEHLSEFVRLASGKTPMPLHNQGEVLEKSYQFMMSEKPFRPGTKNVFLDEIPPPPRLADKEAALTELEQELTDFQRAYAGNPDRRVTNPFFGELNYGEQVQLLHKHFTHHLRQFGL